MPLDNPDSPLISSLLAVGVAILGLVAVQVLANERVLEWDRSKLNVHGGAIALGHPTGISGARIVVTLYNALVRVGGELGIAAICGGGGVSMAMIIKRES